MSLLEDERYDEVDYAAAGFGVDGDFDGVVHEAEGGYSG